MQEVAGRGAAASDELQVDVGFAERGRAVETGRVFAQRNLDQDGLDLANDLPDRRRGRLRCFRIGQRDLGRGSRRRCLGERLWKRLFDDGGRPSQGPPVLDRSDQLEYRRLAPNTTYFERHGASRR
jgi:hypothetical protein